MQVTRRSFRREPTEYGRSYRTGFDARFTGYSPGIMVFEKTIEEMIREKSVKLFYLPLGDEEYKFRLGAEEYTDACFKLTPPKP